MVVAMFIRNGKTFVNKLQTTQTDGINVTEAQQTNNCPFDNAELKRIYDYTQYTGCFTEYPEDWLPVSFKKANVETITLWECKSCQKRFISWFNVSESEEFHEAKIFPDNSYNEIREGEVGMIQPPIPENNSKGGLNSPEACDCGGNCDNDNCKNNKMNNKFDRPVWYG
jgi:hypothetical protein